MAVYYCSETGGICNSDCDFCPGPISVGSQDSGMHIESKGPGKQKFGIPLFNRTPQQELTAQNFAVQAKTEEDGAIQVALTNDKGQPLW